MSVKGIYSSYSGIQGDQKETFAGKILKTAYASTAPLLALSSGVKREQLLSKIVHWFEQMPDVARTTTASNVNATATSIVVADSSMIRPKTVLMIETSSEYVLVESVSGTTLTIKRGFGGTTAAAINGSVTPVGVQLIATAFEDGSAAPEIIRNVGYAVYNYAQTFRHTYGVTRSAQRIATLTNQNSLSSNKAEAVGAHATEIERAMLMGVADAQQINQQPAYTMGGLMSMIKSNKTAITSGTGTTMDDIMDFLAGVFKYSITGMNNERVAICGNTVLSVIDKLVRKDKNTSIIMDNSGSQTSEYGLSVNKLKTPFGSVALLTHDFFNQSPLHTGSILVYHPGALKTHYMDDAVITPHGKTGVDADTGDITSELSLEYNCEKTAGLMTGILTAAEPVAATTP